jgi:hypothetical protein
VGAPLHEVTDESVVADRLRRERSVRRPIEPLDLSWQSAVAGEELGMIVDVLCHGDSPPQRQVRISGMGNARSFYDGTPELRDAVPHALERLRIGFVEFEG